MRFGITIVWAAASAWTVSSTPTQLVAHPSTGRPMPWSSQLSERNAANTGNSDWAWRPQAKVPKANYVTAKRPDAIQDALLTRLMSIPELSKYPETLGLVSDVMAFVDEQDDGGDITLAGGPSASKLDPYSKLLLSAKLEVTESTLVMAEAAKEEPESSAPDEKKYTETSKQKEDKKKDLVTKVMLGVKSGSVLFTFADDYDQFVKCFKNLVYLKNKIMTGHSGAPRKEYPKRKPSRPNNMSPSKPRPQNNASRFKSPSTKPHPPPNSPNLPGPPGSLGIPTVPASLPATPYVPPNSPNLPGLPGSLGIPTVPASLPNAAMPPIAAHPVSAPSLPFPPITIPKVGLPSIKVPPVKLPSFGLPKYGGNAGKTPYSSGNSAFKSHNRSRKPSLGPSSASYVKPMKGYWSPESIEVDRQLDGNPRNIEDPRLQPNQEQDNWKKSEEPQLNGKSAMYLPFRGPRGRYSKSLPQFSVERVPQFQPSYRED